MPGGSPAPWNAYSSLLSRDLQRPATTILAYLELLDQDGILGDAETLRRYLSVVRGSAADLARIASELTTFADLTGGRDPATAAETPTSLPLLVEQLANGRPLRVEATAEASATAVETDRLRLVLAQLLDNAVRYGAAGAEVLVRADVAPDPARLVVRVTNQGPPIPDTLRETLFVPFRGGGGKRAPDPCEAGLGLFVARRAAEGAGGTLVLEPGARTTFRLELPVRDAPLAREAHAAREQAVRADAQVLVAMHDLRALRESADRERRTREMAEAQQMLAIKDFRDQHRRAVQLAERLDRAYLDTITALARAVEARDNYTGSHVERVRSYSLRIAERLGISGEALRQLEFGAVLHDVGKIGVPDAILHKPGPLDPTEWALMRHHPDIARRVLEGITFLGPALDAVAAHHERWDGAGYPLGLAGQAIPLGGRIVAVADAYDAMISDRVYRSGLPRSTALAELEQGRGAQFDPDIAEAFLSSDPGEITPSAPF